MELRENEPLARHTTLRTGGPARYFIEAATIADLHDAVQFARDRRLPVAILGGGSNLLAADAGFAGAVIHVANRGFKLIETAPGNAVVEAEAGEEWDAFVSATVAG
jgi:UDP-N-acetylmuramate dehydrogenase